MSKILRYGGYKVNGMYLHLLLQVDKSTSLDVVALLGHDTEGLSRKDGHVDGADGVLIFCVCISCAYKSIKYGLASLV